MHALLSLLRCVFLSCDDVVTGWLFAGGLRLEPVMVLVVDVEILVSSPSVSLLRIATCCSFER